MMEDDGRCEDDRQALAGVNGSMRARLIAYGGYWLPVIVWMTIIFAMSTDMFSADHTRSFIRSVILFLSPAISGEMLDWLHGLVRKLAHVCEYTVLGLLLFRAFRAGSTEQRARHWAGSSLVVVVLYAATDELHQSFVASRTASMIDVGIDAAGGCIAQCIGIWLHRRRLRQADATRRLSSPDEGRGG